MSGSHGGSRLEISPEPSADPSEAARKPAVAVIVPAYNAARYLPHTIESVLAQSFSGLEVVVVDDGSTDDTFSVATNLTGDPRLTVLSKQNGGVATARNFGASHLGPSVRYLLFLDADDVLRPDAIELLVSAADQNPECVAVHGASARIDGTGAQLDDVGWEQLDGRLAVAESGISAWRVCPLQPSDPTSFAAFAYRNPITTPGQLLIRRDCFDRTERFRQRFRLAEDWDLYMQLAAMGPVGFVPEVVLDYRRHSSAASTDLRSMRRAELAVRCHWSTDPLVTAAARRSTRQGHRAFELRRSQERLRLALAAVCGVRVADVFKEIARAGTALGWILRSYVIGFRERTGSRGTPGQSAGADVAPRTVVHIPVTYRRAGTEQIVLDLAEAAVKRGWRSVVVVPANPALDSYPDEVHRIGAESVRVGALFESDRSPLRNMRSIYRTLRQFDADIVHFHFPWAPTCFEAVVAAWLARVPVRLRTEHNPIVEPLPRRQLLKLALLDLLVTEIVCVSIGNRERHVVNGRRRRSQIRVIPNGVRTAAKLLSASESQQLRTSLAADGVSLLAMVGALEERKGVLDFVRLAAAVDRRDTTQFLVVGTGPLRNEAKALASELGVSENVQFLGQRQDIAALLQVIDIYVQPSYYEGMSIAMLEALVAGRPMVSTDVDGVADVDALCAVPPPDLCPAGDINSLAEAVCSVLDDLVTHRNRAQTRAACVDAHFSVGAMCERYLNRYEELLGRPGDAPHLGSTSVH